MIKTCKHCNVEFDTNSTAKRQAGGKINECPSCVEELGTYSSAWKAVTGFNKGKSCHLSGTSTNIGGRPMRHVTYVGGNGNHKGKG